MTKAFYDSVEDVCYFRVTEDQWKELTCDFFESKKQAGENSKHVRYAYEELFDGEKDQEYKASSTTSVS